MAKINFVEKSKSTSPTKGVSVTNEDITFSSAGGYTNWSNCDKVPPQSPRLDRGVVPPWFFANQETIITIQASKPLLVCR